MNKQKRYSLLYPNEDTEYRTLNDTVLHDLGIDALSQKLSDKETEQKMILRTLSKMTADPYVTQYRCGVFEDVLRNKAMRKELMDILDHINFLRSYSGLCKTFKDDSSIWDLLHCLDEISDYIKSVEGLYAVLNGKELHSDGMLGLKSYIQEIYEDSGFDAMKKDVADLKADTSSLQSLTLGVNLNARFECISVGLVSVNSKPFTKSNAFTNFSNHLMSKSGVRNTTDWDGDMKYTPAPKQATGEFGPILGAVTKAMATQMGIADGDHGRNIARTFDQVVSQTVSGMVKKLRAVLVKYVNVSIINMVELMPELVYYIRWAEYIENQTAKGFTFSKAEIADGTDASAMDAKGIFNIKLIANDNTEMKDIVTNDIFFDQSHRVYILTGANRGGKTTITQAVGQLFVLAQGGIYIPGESLTFAPVDSIFSHFPADEDKTFDLGRLGEECKRFKEIFAGATDKSLILLNETFSTTSFEEGYYIAKDSIRAILSKGVRTIYNTHMHKLAFDLDEINDEKNVARAYSLVVQNDGENRSYKVEIAPPSGKSFAEHIARKYGVTYDMLMSE